MASWTMAVLLLAAAPPHPSVAAGQRMGARLPIPVKVLRYAQRLVDRYDTNGDGRLDQAEWHSIQGDSSSADADGDGFLTMTELADRIARYGRRRKIRLMPALEGGAIRLPSLLSPEMRSRRSSAVAERPVSGSSAGGSATGSRSAGRSRSRRARPRDTRFTVSRAQLPKGLPASFLALDRDGDAQLTMAEFAPEGSRSALLQFTRYDTNGDGVITPQEFLAGPRGLGQQGVPGQEEVEEAAVEGSDHPDAGGPAARPAAQRERIRPREKAGKTKPHGVGSAAARKLTKLAAKRASGGHPPPPPRKKEKP